MAAAGPHPRHALDPSCKAADSRRRAGTQPPRPSSYREPVKVLAQEQRLAPDSVGVLPLGLPLRWGVGRGVGRPIARPQRPPVESTTRGAGVLLGSPAVKARCTAAMTSVPPARAGCGPRCRREPLLLSLLLPPSRPGPWRRSTFLASLPPPASAHMGSPSLRLFIAASHAPRGSPRCRGPAPTWFLRRPTLLVRFLSYSCGRGEVGRGGARVAPRPASFVRNHGDLKANPRDRKSVV